MEILDGDEEKLRDDFGKIAKRDIVQFVKFREFKHNQTALAENVLKEIPDQVVGYMEMNKIKIKKLVVDMGAYFRKLTTKKLNDQSMVDFFKNSTNLQDQIEEEKS